MDAGIRCASRPSAAVSKYFNAHPFELRAARILRMSRARSSWMLMRLLPRNISRDSQQAAAAWCDQLVAHERLREQRLDEQRSAERAATVAAARARREQRAANRTLRCSDDSSGRQPDWRDPRSPQESSLLLAHRPSCPGKDWLTLWHTRSRVTGKLQGDGCCTGGRELIYDPCDASAAGSDPHARSGLARRAAAALRGERVLSLGDSLSTQWAAALVLDLRGRGLLEEEAEEESEPASALTSELTRRKRNGGRPRSLEARLNAVPADWCGSPQKADWILDTRGGGPAIASWSVRRLLANNASRREFGGGHGGDVCAADGGVRSGFWQGLGTKLASTLERVLWQYRPTVVSANIGLHYDTKWPGQVEENGAYELGMRALLDVLTKYAAAQSATAAAAANPAAANPAAAADRHAVKRPPPLIIFRESFPQHFWTARGDGAYKEQQRLSNAQWLAEQDVDPSSCSRITWNDPALDASVHDGPIAINRIARRVLRDYPSVVTLPAYQSLAQRAEMHVHPGATERDCTHFCYEPLLWDTVLAPFYAAVDDWAGGGARSGAGVGGAGRSRIAGKRARARAGVPSSTSASERI